LPRYGSNVLLIPEHDIGVFAFAHRTYAPAALVVRQASARLYETGALKAVNKRGSDALVRIEQAVAKIYASGSVTAEPSGAHGKFAVGSFGGKTGQGIAGSARATRRMPGAK
jgi:hypothetical protein